MELEKNGFLFRSFFVFGFFDSFYPVENRLERHFFPLLCKGEKVFSGLFLSVF